MYKMIIWKLFFVMLKKNLRLNFYFLAQVPLDKGYFVQDDLRMVVTDEEKDALLFSDEEDKMNMGSR